MAVAELQAVVALPRAAVFAALSDLARRPALDPSILELEGSGPAAGAAAAGSVFTGRSAITGSDGGFEGSVTAIEEPSLIALGLRQADGARFHETWRLTETPSGTLLRYRAELRLPGGLFGRLLDGLLVGAGFRRQREAVLARIKAALEAEPPGG